MRSKQLYRSKNGLILGVCQGVADWRELPVFWVRLITLLAVLLTGIWFGVIAYFVAGVFMKPEPTRGHKPQMKQAERTDRSPNRRRKRPARQRHPQKTNHPEAS